MNLILKRAKEDSEFRIQNRLEGEAPKNYLKTASNAFKDLFRKSMLDSKYLRTVITFDNKDVAYEYKYEFEQLGINVHQDDKDLYIYWKDIVRYGVATY